MSVYYVLNGTLKPLTLLNLEELLNCFRYPNALDNLHDLELEWAEATNNISTEFDIFKCAYLQQFGEIYTELSENEQSQT